MARRKTRAEEKVERLTWFALVGIFAVLSLLPENTFPNYAVPLAGAIVLFLSGFYQYARKWRVSPITWVAASILLVAAGYGWRVNPQIDLLPVSLLAFMIIIGFGVLTGET
ncbi:MAG: hypothetical protein D6712_07345 [Chloroflexi bacterium]|nr:MAG: hypothetical protein D6712_07345 [Chloroflexota bacterium]